MQLLPDPPAPFERRILQTDALRVDQGGAIAQLGERLVCNQKVAGSIPAGSTTLQSLPLNVTHEFLRGAPCAHRVLFNNLVSFVFDAKFSSES